MRYRNIPGNGNYWVESAGRLQPRCDIGQIFYDVEKQTRDLGTFTLGAHVTTAGFFALTGLVALPLVRRRLVRTRRVD